MTKTFVSVTANDKPGELGRICQTLANSGINIEGFASTAGQVRFLTSDNRKAMDALKKAGYDSKEVEVFQLRLSNRPGELARVGKALGDANVNIDTAFGFTSSQATGDIFLRVNDVKKATPILEKLARETGVAQITH